MTLRDSLRNIAIIAHVDHGKTTLVDAMLRQTGSFATHGDAVDRVMDSGDLEREKGITILAKNTAVNWNGTTINIIDTPGHADFGGEVERGLAMVDGVILLVDAAEGPLPQTRFVLRKTLARRLPVILLINKVDRPDARVEEVVSEVEELFLDLDADEDQISFPVMYASAKQGWAGSDWTAGEGTLEPLFQLIHDAIPAPEYEEGHGLQALVCNLDASPYLGRLALCRVVNGTLQRGARVAWCRRDGTIEHAKVTELFITEALERVPAESAGPGDIVAVAGFEEITIGETLADPENPQPLPLITVDEPSLSMTIGINTSPLAGREGKLLTARVVKDRLDKELVGNVSLRVLNTDRPDAWEVQGRGELQLAILIETMRREGFELTIGKPRVVTKEVDGVLNEPFERVTVDIPEEFVGNATALLSQRRGSMLDMVNHGTGWVRLEWRIPARGLVGVRTEFMTETRGTGILNSVFDGYSPWVGEIRHRLKGTMVADRSGVTTPYCLIDLEARGILFVDAGVDVYEGMIIGENSRADEMNVNPTKEKKLTNMRASGSDNTERMSPPTVLSLEQALEFIADDEAVEVTPKTIRLRKVVLDANTRARLIKSEKNRNA
jgi:GTP-binding protein